MAETSITRGFGKSFFSCLRGHTDAMSNPDGNGRKFDERSIEKRKEGMSGSPYTQYADPILHEILIFHHIANLQHNNTHTIHLRPIYLIVLIHATAQLRRSPVEQVKVQLAIAGLELVVFEEERVVEQR